MPVLTPNYSLPVPGPLDEPCDFPEQWCDFTDGVQAVLDGFESIANRTNPWVPVAKMELRNTVTLINDSILPFDTLTLNNAGMVDFDASNTTMTIKRPGRFLAVCNALFVANTTPNSWFGMQFIGPVTTPAFNHSINIGAINVGMTTTGIMHVATVPESVRVKVHTDLGPSSLLIDLASLALFWYADGASP